MQREDYDNMKSLEEILEKELKKEMSRITTAGTLNPTDVKTLTDAVCLMLKLKEYEQWMESGEGSRGSYGQYRNTNNGRYMSNANYRLPHVAYAMPYDMGYSGHSTRDRMVSALEDIMGEAKNEYEASMIRDAIAYIQNGK